MRTTVNMFIDKDVKVDFIDVKTSIALNIDGRNNDISVFIKKADVKDFISKMQKAFEEIEKEQND
jgi:mannose/fructose/N-acetylgalactosamine-specific phosphotransferase system component IIB